MTKNDIFNKIHHFIKAESGFDDDVLQSDTNIFEEGLVDSLFVVSLVEFAESEFNCEIDNSEISDDNFSTVELIAEFIYKRLG